MMITWLLYGCNSFLLLVMQNSIVLCNFYVNFLDFTLNFVWAQKLYKNWTNAQKFGIVTFYGSSNSLLKSLHAKQKHYQRNIMEFDQRKKWIAIVCIFSGNPLSYSFRTKLYKILMSKYKKSIEFLHLLIHFFMHVLYGLKIWHVLWKSKQFHWDNGICYTGSEEEELSHISTNSVFVRVATLFITDFSWNSYFKANTQQRFSSYA